MPKIALFRPLVAAGGVLALFAFTLVALPTVAHADTTYPYTLASSKLKIGFGQDGSIQSLKIADDLYDTEYVMNPDVAPAQAADPQEKYKQWLGNLMFSYSFAGGQPSEAGVGGQPWQTAWTTESSDGRTVTATDKSVTVTYVNSSDEQGVKGFTVTETYTLEDDGSLRWEQAVTNTSATDLTIGDWGTPIPTNELWVNGGSIYEERALTHSYVGKDSSYVTMERPSGQGPFVMVSTDAASGSDFEYQDRWIQQEVGQTPWASDNGGNIKGLNVYYANSMAIQKTNRGYLGSTSSSIAPQATKTQVLRISKVNDDEGRHQTLYDKGSLDSVAVPGMIVPFDQPADLALRVKGQITSVQAKNHNDLGGPNPTDPQVAFSRANGDYRIYRLTFDRSQLGTNDVTVNYTTPEGTRASSVLQFMVVDNVAKALDDHAQFMVDNTQWTPKDNLPAGDVRLYTFDDWMMNATDGSLPTEQNGPRGRRNEFYGYWGLGDDWGFPHAQFLAEKEVALPVANQVQALDNYLDVAVWQTLMGNTDPNAAPKYLVYDFWEQGKPGSLNTTPSYRGYAYPHVYNTFFSMYQVASQNPDLITYRHPAKWYLTQAYGIFKELYDGPVAYNWHTGLMGELTTPALIDALRKEGMNDQADDITSKMETKYKNFSAQKYPYGSEYSYDNTGEEAVYTLARLNVDTDTAKSLRMMRDIVAKTEASRGREPAWYWYSDPVGINGENWWQFQYTAALAGYTMDDYINHTAALETGADTVSPDRRAELQRLNYASKLAAISQINSGQISNHPANIGASAWTYQAERGNQGTLGVGGGPDVQLLNGWRGMTGESDLGIWGTLQTLSADVVTDDPIFGTVGYGASVTEDSSSTTVEPRDGLQRRLNLITQQLSFDLTNDRYAKATVAKDSGSLTVEMDNVSGKAHSGSVNISGLPAGTYNVVVDGVAQRKVNNYPAPGTTLAAPTVATFDAPAGQSFTVRVEPTTADANRAPTVDAGADQSGLELGIDDVVLNGAVSDDGLGQPNGSLTTLWSVTSTPDSATATIADPNATRTAVTVDKPGQYVFTLTGSDGLLNASDSVSVTVVPLKPMPAQWVSYDFDSATNGVVPDTTGNGNNLTLNGNATVEKDGDATVLKLDGSNGTFGQLPNDIFTRSKDVTITTRVKLDKSDTWNRLWDIGSGMQRNVFVTAKGGDGFLGLGITDGGNATGSSISTAYTVPLNTWITVKTTFVGNGNGTTTGTIYVDGQQVGQNKALTLAPKDVGRTNQDYLGKSQYGDPLMVGSIDSFSIDGSVDDGSGPTPTVSSTVTPSQAGDNGWSRGPATVALQLSQGDGAIQYRMGDGDWLDYSAPVSVTDDGRHVLQYRVLKNGNPVEGASGSVDINVDGTAPKTTTSVSPASGSAPIGQTVTATFTASDATSGVASTEYTVDGGDWTKADASGVTVSDKGAHVVQYRSVDSAGNVEQTHQITLTIVDPGTGVTVDITSAAPANADGWYRQPVLVALKAPEAEQTLQFSVNGGDWKTYRWAISVINSGTTKIGYRALEDNMVVDGSASETIVKIDRSIPIVKAALDPNTRVGTPRNPISVDLTATDATSGVARIEYRTNDGDWTPVQDGTVTLDQVGEYVVSYRATDNAGNVSAARAVVVSIREDPTTRLVARRSVQAGQPLTVTAAGFVRYSDVTFTVGDTVVGTATADRDGTARLTVATANLAKGSTTLTATQPGSGLTVQQALIVR